MALALFAGVRPYLRGGEIYKLAAAVKRDGVGQYFSERSPTAQVKTHWKREAVLAESYAYLRRSGECIEVLGKLLRVPGGLTVPILRVDPVWDNIRDDARFKALLADPKNSAPL